MQDFINKHFYNLFVFTLIFGILLYDLIGFDYTDEFCALFLFIIFGYYLFKTPEWPINKAFFITLLIFIFYFVYSLIINSNSKAAIISDLLIQIKPYLAFFCVYSLVPIFSNNQKAILRIITVFFWSILLLIGVSEFVYPGALKATMGHESYFAAAVVSVSFCYLFASNYSSKDKLIFFLMLSLGLLSGRSKFYGFYILSIAIIFYFSNLQNFKLNFKNICILLGVFAVMILVAWNKIELYFLQGITDENQKDLVARYVLYATSLSIFMDYFPFGSGFASFATFSSGVYYSDIYSKYGIDNVWGISRTFYSYIADTYYPSLAQFGVIGLCLYISFWIYIIHTAYKYFTTIKDAKLITLILLIVGYFAIESTSDSTYTTHRGFFIMMILGLVLSNMKHQSLLKKEDKNESITN